MKSSKPVENILIVMADQLSALALGCYGNACVRSPNADRLAEEGVVFDAAYSSSPLCAPSRYAMMTGLHVSKCGGYDNAAYMPSTMPTFAHYMRLRGYRTLLCGKMHFIGPDQLHGFERRTNPDIYPPDFSWTPDWENAGARIDSWYHNMSSVTQAGVAAITSQLAYDDAVGADVVREIYQHARGRDDDPRPFCMVVGFIHPHDPYAARQRDWDLYEGVEIAPPAVGRLGAEQDAHGKRLEKVIALDAVDLSEADIVRARRAYYANVSYVDRWLGKFRAVLEECGLAENTTVMFTSDHGDMLGERGLWYKMSFMEWANRVPLIISRAAQFAGKGQGQGIRVAQAVSHVDLLPTLLEIAGENEGANLAAAKASAVNSVALGKPIGLGEIAHSGRSLLGLCGGGGGKGDGEEDVAISEYMAEGTSEPMLMIRRGRYKFIACAGDADLLFDLQADPNELQNLAGSAEHSAVVEEMHARAAAHWDVAEVKAEVLASQRERRVVQAALDVGQRASWEFVPPQEGGRVADSDLDLTEFDIRSRYPRPSKFNPRFT